MSQIKVIKDGDVLLKEGFSCQDNEEIDHTIFFYGKQETGCDGNENRMYSLNISIANSDIVSLYVGKNGSRPTYRETSG